jgi:hypothetical protein
MYLEFLEDTGQEIDPKMKKDLSLWIEKFAPENFFCIVTTHCKKYVGMSWGLTGEKMTLDGIFIKRGFRGRLRAIKKISDALRELLQQSKAIAICSVVPENQVKRVLRKGFKVSGIVIEKRLGANWQTQHRRA